ncbi:integrase arm-type DNA-binding domain-containing protein [Erythrobacter sp. AP23]|uniref:integrase arm-type DNA-binding domain-containing protein n=1 Tax=Erythrobacter sp. AP23 TaxID=499656 RepID=UPI000A57FE04|nr:integrase arm-type DNA-binding domain-containing protein [Erythrobacter sp. AP23]
MTERIELTDSLVSSLPPPSAGPYVQRDTLPGFYVVVGKRAKTFTVQCDVRDELGRRRTKKLALGRHGELTVKQARARAKAELGALQVAGRFEERRKQWTVREAWEHMRDYELPAKGSRPRTVEGYQKTIDRLMGDWRDVTLRKFADNPRLVVERHRAVTRDNGPYAANHFGRAFRRLYNYAQAKLDPTLPLIAWGKVISFNREQRSKDGMGEEELRDWFVQLGNLSNEVRREFHLFTLLSGSRPDALSKARWSDLNVRRRALRITEPKGGPDRAFDIPLSRPMLACLIRARKAGRKLCPRQSATFIFPANKSRSGHLSEWKEDRTELAKWGKQLRQTYTIAAEWVDVSERTLKRLLNHKTQDVTMGYGDRDRMWPRLVAEQERISAHIMAQVPVKDERFELRAERDGNATVVRAHVTRSEAAAIVEDAENDISWPEGHDAVLCDSAGTACWFLADGWEAIAA